MGPTVNMKQKASSLPKFKIKDPEKYKSILTFIEQYMYRSAPDINIF